MSVRTDLHVSCLSQHYCWLATELISSGPHLCINARVEQAARVCFIKSIALKLTTSACRVQEWVFEASITFTKCLGGAPGGEGVLVTCSDGNVFDIFLDNPFPVSLWQHDVLVQSADLSADKDALALVDQNAQLVVVDLSRSQVRCCISLHA